MRRRIRMISGCVAAIFLMMCGCANAKPDELNDLPGLPKDTKLFASEQAFGYRGKIGAFVIPPSRIGTYFDKTVYYDGGDLPGLPPGACAPDLQSMKVQYVKPDKKSFCGAYMILLADMSTYKTLTFLVKGERGGESFEIGLNDVISNKREDAVYIDSVNRYLEHGVTKEWQVVKIPLVDFYGPDISKSYSLIFAINDISEGTLWIDQIRFHKDDLATRERADFIKQKGYLMLDDFNSSDLNLLGRKTNAYKKLPSVCIFERDDRIRYGDSGKSLRIDYKKESTGWCGYYTMLNQIDGEYYDLRPYKAVSFMIKGAKGGERFEVGMADKNWVIIGDSLKAGSVTKYLPKGVTAEWQEVIIPLEDFGLLDFSEMGSFVMNFNEKEEGTVYIDNLKFYLKEEKK